MKNIWSLNIDELLVAEKLKEIFKKTDYEVLFPLNAQMKDIDLILVDLKSDHTTRLQVKGSRTFPSSKTQIKRWGDGGVAWFTINKKSIFNPKNGVSYYILVSHSTCSADIKKEIRINFLIIPADKFRKFCLKKTLGKSSTYSFYIWIDPNGKRAFDFRDTKGKELDLSEYLDNWSVIKE